LNVLSPVRFVRYSVLAASLVAIAVSVVLAGRSPSAPQSLSALLGGGLTDTRWGPLGPSDRDLLIKIRQADLWDGPAGQQAAERAAGPAVRSAGAQLSASHAALDAGLLAVAERLRVTLPSQPSDQQKVWLATLSAAPPSGYDRKFVNLTRAAYGELMPLIDGVRAGTQNELVRRLAMAASAQIDPNMQLLEATGLVDYGLLPPSTSPAARLTAIGGYTVPVTLLLFLAAVFVAALMLRGLAPRRDAAGPDGSAGKPLFGRPRGLAVRGSAPVAGGSGPAQPASPRRLSVQPATAPTRPTPDHDSGRSPGRSPVDSPTVPAPREELDRRPPKLGKSRGVRGW
jgi:predicted outer membrane protein